MMIIRLDGKALRQLPNDVTTNKHNNHLKMSIIIYVQLIQKKRARHSYRKILFHNYFHFQTLL